MPLNEQQQRLSWPFPTEWPPPLSEKIWPTVTSKTVQEKVTSALTGLAHEVQNGRFFRPSPIELTCALKSLFPGEIIIEETKHFALCDTEKFGWRIEPATGKHQIIFSRYAWLKRKLTSFL